MKLILMVGAPGSGKSYLARQLAVTHNAVICSADHFHMWWGNGEYKFDPANLPHAHSQCQSYARLALSKGRNVIIDNTNVKKKERQIYLDIAKSFDADVSVEAPSTEWYFNAEECFKRNQHNVPLPVIERMINSIRNGE